MVNAMVDRATSDMLIGPDWAMNIEICDICNHDPAQAKGIVRGIKKRLGSRNAKVQLLALTLLETVVKNCGDIGQMYVAELDLPYETVKIVKKKLQPDSHVKEKILILIDTWQEAFGGIMGRYPQYYVAYQDLLSLGAVFPKRSESSAPVFTPQQTHPLTSYPQNLHNPESESSAEAEFPTLRQILPLSSSFTGMASSSSQNSETSSKSLCGGGPGFVCDCKLPVVVRSLNSIANPNRRCMWCPKYTGFQCDFFKWLDPPNPQFFEGAMPEVDTDVERRKQYKWIGKCARLEQQIVGVEAKSRELELKFAHLKCEKKKIKKELMICRFVICSLLILLVAFKLG